MYCRDGMQHEMCSQIKIQPDSAVLTQQKQKCSHLNFFLHEAVTLGAF